MTTERTSPATTPPTAAHDSATCTLGPARGKCEMCRWANSVQTATEDCPICLNSHHGYDPDGYVVDCPNAVALDGLTIVEQSATAIRARRAALLERTDIHSPTEGAITLADAHLQSEGWWQQLPNNTMQDATVLELAGEIEGVIGSWLQGRQEEE